MLVQAAWSAVRTKDSYFRAFYYRIKSRRGPQKAIVAVAAAMLRACYVMMRDHVDYRDLGPDHFPRLDKNKLIRRHLHRLRELGVQVERVAPLRSCSQSIRPRRPGAASTRMLT